MKRLTSKEREVAKNSVSSLSVMMPKSGKVETMVIQIEGTKLEVPRKAMDLWLKVLSEMAEGNSVTVASFGSELSTQEAADLLQVSRPHLVKLLETGKIPFKKVGVHRRVNLSDVIKYETELKKERKTNLGLLAEEAQELGMGY